MCHTFYIHKLYDSILVARLCVSHASQSKIQIYKTIIRPTVTYGFETWVLTASDENQLYIFERKILRKIYGPTKNPEGTWRIKTNDELRHRMKQEDIIQFIKSQRLEIGSPCNENGEYKNCQKNNRMDAIQNKTSRETQVKVDRPGRRRPKEDENYWLEGEGRG